jgi:hypothetical protein
VVESSATCSPGTRGRAGSWSGEGTGLRSQTREGCNQNIIQTQQIGIGDNASLSGLNFLQRELRSSSENLQTRGISVYTEIYMNIQYVQYERVNQYWAQPASMKAY